VRFARRSPRSEQALGKRAGAGAATAAKHACGTGTDTRALRRAGARAFLPPAICCAHRFVSRAPAAANAAGARLEDGRWLQKAAQRNQDTCVCASEESWAAAASQSAYFHTRTSRPLKQRSCVHAHAAPPARAPPPAAHTHALVCLYTAAACCAVSLQAALHDGDAQPLRLRVQLRLQRADGRSQLRNLALRRGKNG
jgi:hypothetical protein